jgi:chemotaxis protein MotB
MKNLRIVYKTIFVLAMSFAAIGCVSSKKYQAALDDIARMRADSTLQASQYADLQYDKTKQLADAKEEIRSANKQRDSLANVVNQRNQLLDRITEQLHAALPAVDNEKLDTYIDEEFLHISLPHRVLFNTGETKLSDDGRKVVQQITSTLGDLESDIMILGHADSVPFVSSLKDNWELSLERAQSVMHEMVQSGISPEKLIIAGRGDYEPSLNNKTQIGRLLNRRIELIVMPDMQVIESVMEQVSTAENQF